MRNPFLLFVLAACSSSSPSSSEPPAASKIKHLVVMVQENHSFDAYFGAYCTAPAGTRPACTDGTACCEAAPSKEPGAGATAVALTDDENGTWDPNHTQACEVAEMNGGKMDQYVRGADCSSPKNFAVAPALQAYWDLAKENAL